MERVDAAEPRRPEVLGAEQVGGAPVGDERALAIGRDEDADPAGPRARRRAMTRGVTPSARIVSTSARPAASRPTAPISVVRAPSRPSQRAVFAAEPPGDQARRGPGRRCRSRAAAPGARTTSTHEVAEHDDPRGPSSPDARAGPARPTRTVWPGRRESGHAPMVARGRATGAATYNDRPTDPRPHRPEPAR